MVYAALGTKATARSPISIPDRDSGYFTPLVTSLEALSLLISIPDKDSDHFTLPFNQQERFPNFPLNRSPGVGLEGEGFG